MRRYERQASAEAMQVELAIKHQGRGVVGVDLSGNPTVGTWETWRPALQRAKDVCALFHHQWCPTDADVLAWRLS